jgi:hypothetical protein
MQSEVCGAKSRAGTPCRQPSMLNGRCRSHGGLTPKGTESPHFVHGIWSAYWRDPALRQAWARERLRDGAGRLSVAVARRRETSARPSAGDTQEGASCGCAGRGRTGRPCQQTILCRNGRCRLHVGRVPSGIGSPHYVHGGYTRLSAYPRRRRSRVPVEHTLAAVSRRHPQERRGLRVPRLIGERMDPAGPPRGA